MNNKLKIVLSHTILGVLSIFLGCTPARSQIVPDTTLGVQERSVIISIPKASGIPNTIISGGSRRGSSLFHSFKDFNINLGQEAYFTNPDGISNILVRVTGGNPSNLNGTLGSLGYANLFFINPKGVLLGPNARLFLGGSFLASTADAVKLSDGSRFSAINPQPVPLLTVNIPVGLEFTTGHPGNITVEGTGQNIFFSNPPQNFSLDENQLLTGLTAAPGKNIALVGGQVNFSGAVITAPSGQIEVGSINSGLVSISSTATGLSLNYNQVQSFQDIQINNRSLLNASGFGNENILLQAHNITISDGSLVLLANFGNLPSGKIGINASGTLTLDGTTSYTAPPGLGLAQGLATLNFSNGKGGDIVISANNLIVQEKTFFLTSTFGNGNGGDISINLKPSNELISDTVPYTLIDGSLLGTFAYSNGHAGNITLSTAQLSVLNSASFASETFNSGNGGNITINASDSVKISGSNQIIPGSFLPSLLGAFTASSGQSGKVTINTNRLTVEKGGRLFSSTFADGSANQLVINATESVDVSNSVTSSLNPTSIDSSGSKIDNYFTPVFGLPSIVSGKSGDLTINTGQLKITDGAQVSVKNDGSGVAGKLQINANSIYLGDQASIRSSSVSGDGGDITINTNFLSKLSSSRISANAIMGKGGRVTINTQALFPSTIENITAKGMNTQFNGITQINIPFEVNAARASANPTPVLQSPEVSSICASRKGTTSSFVNTGTGGTPPNPNDVLRSNTGWQQDSLHTQQGKKAKPKKRTSIKNESLIPATGVMFYPDGTMSFISNSFKEASSSSGIDCSQANIPEK